jgi:hypothetical protein
MDINNVREAPKFMQIGVKTSVHTSKLGRDIVSISKSRQEIKYKIKDKIHEESNPLGGESRWVCPPYPMNHFPIHIPYELVNKILPLYLSHLST